jgi:hypothetical protein
MQLLAQEYFIEFSRHESFQFNQVITELLVRKLQPDSCTTKYGKKEI